MVLLLPAMETYHSNMMYFRLLSLILLAFVFASSLQAQSGRHTPTQDTVFLVKEVTPTEYLYVYIDPHNSPERRDFEDDRFLSDLVSDAFRCGYSVKHKDLHTLPKGWVSLNQYKGKLYRYDPCDGSDWHVFFTDSTILTYAMEPDTQLLDSVEWVGDSIIRIYSVYSCSHCEGSSSAVDSVIDSATFKGSFNETAEQHYVWRTVQTFQILNPVTKLAIWNNETLMVPVANAQSYSLIICECGPDLAPHTFSFEPIDIAKWAGHPVPNWQGQNALMSIPVPPTLQPAKSH